MSKIKCWNCGIEIPMPYTDKEIEILDDPFSDDDEIFAILDKREFSTKRVFCEKCKAEHEERHAQVLHEYCRLRNMVMYERALRIFERQNLDIYEYKEAADAVKEYIQERFSEKTEEDRDKYVFDSADEVATAIVFIANEINIKVHPKVLKYEVDFIVPSMKVVLEIDGELFHKGKEKRESRRDTEIRQALGQEWEIIRIPAKYVHQNIELLPENVRSLRDERKKVRKAAGGFIPESYSRHRS